MSLSSLRMRFSRRSRSFSRASSRASGETTSVSRCAVTHLFSVESPTPKSSATCRRVSPLVSAIRTASLRNSSVLPLPIVRLLCCSKCYQRSGIKPRQVQTSLEKELATTKKDHAKLVDAIIAGIPAEQVKDRMLALDARRIDLEGKLAREAAPSPVRIHPKMAETYREKVTTLIAELQHPDGMLEAKEALRGLIDRIVLHP